MFLIPDDLPPDWQPTDPGRERKLAAQVQRELPKGHALAGTEFTVLAEYLPEDTVLLDAPDLTPRHYLIHLSWGKDPADPHPLEDLRDLAGMMGPDPEDINDVTLWTQEDSESGLVMVQHLISGRQIIEPLDWPEDVPPTSTDQLKEKGWCQITAPLHPKALWDGVLVPTGQVVEYWVRPVIDDFVLLRAIHTPGEAISLKQLIPPRGEIFEFGNELMLQQALPEGQYCRAVSPIHPGYGLSGFPAKTGSDS
ncbi:hypothetical protein [Pseudooceanicola sp. MF1-13]|uniref:hypothetical protein n=1 Tax=Pseudooceanicola sp. MF1-13 TaxID=3379095 RepID=UPI003892C972